MEKYPKIKPIFEFDKDKKKFVWENFRDENVQILKDNIWIFTEKIDGMNFRIHWDGYKLTYAGRTDKTDFSKMQKEFIEEHLVNSEIEQVFEQIFEEKTVTVYGELFGEKIQNGGLYTNGGLDFRVFDIKVGEVFLKYPDMCALADDLGYRQVPIVLRGTIVEALVFVDTEDTSAFSKAKLEGIVGKPLGDFRDRLGKRIITKIKKRDLEDTISDKTFF